MLDFSDCRRTGIYILTSVADSKKSYEIIVLGFFSGITPKGVALLLNGLPGLRHVVYDVMSDVLTYVDFNTCELVLPRFGLKTFLFHSMELLR